MSEGKEKKSIFDRMIDMVSTRDEKQEVEELQKEVQEAQMKAMAAKEAAAKSSMQDDKEKAELQKRLEEANKRAAEAEAKAKQLENKLQKSEAIPPSEDASRWEERYGRKEKAAGQEIITTHELTSEETLSHLALKYYGHATKPYWMVIYEANKDVVGDNPNLVHKGMQIKIPELPDELKEKD
jgi:nucleoid-associated protein YgaU